MRMKYKSKPVVNELGKFDSKKEYYRYLALLEAEKEGEISNLQRQVRFEILPSQRDKDTVDKNGKVKRGRVLERPVYYVADFVYTENGHRVVEDTKGYRTNDYILKRKLMLYMKGIQIRET